MKNTTRSSGLTARFRPLSLPLQLDYKATSKRRTNHVDSPSTIVNSPPPSPATPSTPTTPMSRHRVTGSLQMAASSLPRILRGSNFLSKPTPPPQIQRSIPAPVTTAPSIYYHPQRAESRCCQMLIHGLFVAFEDDFVDSGWQRPEDLLADGGRPFTHFISLSTRYSASISQTTDRKTGTVHLRLRIPRLYSPNPPSDEEIAERVNAARISALERGDEFGEDEYYDVLFNSDLEGDSLTGFTHLEALQLLAVRDFLQDAKLDEYSTRVLVTTPRDHRTDAIAAVMGYLSVALEVSVHKLLKAQTTHPKILSVWKYVISDACADFIQEVARL